MAKDTISCLCLDLGANLGWAACLCKLRPEISMTVTNHGTVDLNKLTDNRMRLNPNNIYSRNRVKMMIYQEHIIKLVNALKYDCYVSEDVFCNKNMVNAFRALSLYIEVYESIVNIQKQKRLFTVPPTLIKSHVSGYGLSDKSLVQESLLNNPKIKIKRPDQMTNHESDAIACGWSFIHEYIMFRL